MLVTMLEAVVEPDREDELIAAYREAGGETLPPFILQTFLLKGDNGVWRIATVWRSREDFEQYRRSGVTPAGVVTFRAVDAEPELKVFDVAVHRANDQVD